MKNFLSCFLLLLLSVCARSQDCYSFGRQKAIEAFEKGDFPLALQKFEGTQQCPDVPPGNDLAEWIGKTKNRLPGGKAQHSPKAPVEKLPAGEIHWAEGFVQAKGQCLIDRKRYGSDAQALLMAQRGAEVVAKANLLEILQGIEISRGSEVEDYSIKKDSIEAGVKGRLRMARLVGEPVISQDIVEVTVQAPIQ